MSGAGAARPLWLAAASSPQGGGVSGAAGPLRPSGSAFSARRRREWRFWPFTAGGSSFPARGRHVLCHMSFRQRCLLGTATDGAKTHHERQQCLVGTPPTAMSDGFVRPTMKGSNAW
jgi:hypothetical protein